MLTEQNLLDVAALEREVEHRVFANAAKSRTPGADIAEALARCALELLRLSRLSDMPVAYRDQAMRESASMFAGFLPEVCRPLDEMFRRILRSAADNVGGFSPMEQTELERSRIVSETIHDNWLGYFTLAAIGASTEPEVYQQRLARAIELAERTPR